ncbi:tetratricopeptide repeat protein [Singulisphaera sp. PoT]|uniref:tetratricopeptide repeat protein n=1 Tax=Singulisphaera sp. PoT TaxID=3411797 RepID=UPI003BF5B01C
MPRPSSSIVMGSVLLLVSAGPAVADGIPVSALRDWQDFNDYGWIALGKNDYNKAEKRFRDAISVVRPYEAKDPRPMARSYGDLARTLYHQKRYAEAAPLARWSLEVRESNPKTTPEALVQSLYVLAINERAQRHYDAAEPLLKKAMILQEKTLAPGSPDRAVILDELAIVAWGQSRNVDANRFFTLALKIREAALPAEHPDILESLEHYAAFLRQTDRVADAESYEARAKAIRDSMAEQAIELKAMELESRRQSARSR